MKKEWIALRMHRQHLDVPASREEYDELYRDMSPGHNVYWNGFGTPPSLSFRADFDDMAYNGQRLADHRLAKGRFQGGNLGWVEWEDMELFRTVYRKPLDAPNAVQRKVMDAISHIGPMNIHQIKEETGLLTREITPALHRLQEAFWIYEDQFDGEWDRCWCRYEEMFENTGKWTREAAMEELIIRYARRTVWFDGEMVKSAYRLPARDVRATLERLVDGGKLVSVEGGYMRREDMDCREGDIPGGILAMHRNDMLVMSLEKELKARFASPKDDSLQYLLMDGEFHGVSWGHFRNGPYDVHAIGLERKYIHRAEEALEAVQRVNPGSDLTGTQIIELPDGKERYE